ncbi:MAG: response regulator transcription factor [Bacteroidales bacterium]|nr:response regulator transcription factor [Bacteroidales bacterium]
MDKKIKVFIVDDHDIFRDGIKLLLSSGNIAEIIGEASNGQEFLEMVSSYSPDVVLMDIAMPVLDGVETSKRAHEKYPNLKILALTMFGEEKYYYQMIQCGVKGFILKSAGINELLRGISEVARGHSYFSSELIEKIITSLSNQSNQSDIATSGLTKREIEVLKLVALGHTNEEVAGKLNISTTTVRTHRANLISKTGCANTASLVMFAIKNKFVEVC